MILGVEGCRENDHIYQMNVSVYVIGIIVTAVSWNIMQGPREYSHCTLE